MAEHKEEALADTVRTDEDVDSDVTWRQQCEATLMLMLVPVCWGPSFLAVQWALKETSHLGCINSDFAAVMFFLASRLTLSALAMGSVGYTGLQHRSAWRFGLGIGLPTIAMLMLQSIALQYDESAVVAFLMALEVPLATLLSAGLKQECISRGLGACIALGTFGAAFIHGPPAAGFTWPSWVGVSAAVSGAIAAVVRDYIPISADASEKPASDVEITTVQLVVESMVCLVVMIPVVMASSSDSCTGNQVLADLQGVFMKPKFICPLVFLVVFSTCLTEFLMTAYLKYIGPARTALIFTMESVIALFIQYVVETIDGNPKLTTWQVVGMMCILVGNTLSIGINNYGVDENCMDSSDMAIDKEPQEDHALLAAPMGKMTPPPAAM